MNIISNMVEAHLFREQEKGIEFLLLKRAAQEIYPGLWQMVTGRIEAGEKAWETALREIKEETGLTPFHFWVVPRINQFYSPDEDSLILLPVFAALITEFNEVTICEEHCDSKWYSPEEAKQLLAWEGQKKSVDTITDYYLNHRSTFNLLEYKLNK